MTSEAGPAPPPPLYTSTLSLPYSSKTSLNTLDIHHRHPTNPALSPSYWIVYIHGGAFRDPLVSSTSLIPSLPVLFSNAHIVAVASLNYRLSPHPHHPTAPSAADDESRNGKWPEHIEDVRDAVGWLRGPGGMMMMGEEWVVVGHSVGGTMAMMLGLEGEGEGKWGKEEGAMEGLRGVVGMAGIYDFVALRDAHLSTRSLYDAFTTGAFGSEESGAWEKGDVVRCGRKVREGVEVVVVGQSREDELVEWEQAEMETGVLEKEGRDGVGVLVELKGKHQEVVTGGKEVGRCVGVAVGMLVEREKARKGGGR